MCLGTKIYTVPVIRGEIKRFGKLKKQIARNIKSRDILNYQKVNGIPIELLKEPGLRPAISMYL
jgi:hypothetical protein